MSNDLKKSIRNAEGLWKAYSSAGYDQIALFEQNDGTYTWADVGSSYGGEQSGEQPVARISRAFYGDAMTQAELFGCLASKVNELTPEM